MWNFQKVQRANNAKAQAAKVEDERQLAIAYKAVFTGDHGKQVLIDLMNRYFMIQSHGGSKFKEGQRSVICDLATRANIDVTVLDKLLRGEL